jgi:hypothetical protein
MSASAGGCPSAEELQGLVGELLGDADRTVVEAHVETCSACQERLERLVSPTLLLIRPPSHSSVGDGPPAAGFDEVFRERLRQLPVPPPASGPPAGDGSNGSVPTRLGPYEILGHLGEGGMGTVYRARHRELDRVVALKVLPADRVDEAAVARFRNEMRAAGRLVHPNIVTAHDAGRVGGTYFLAMDFIDGADLSALVRRLGPLPVADACELIRQAAVGLQHAGECGLTHRDVKPSNLMLARGGVIKVLDLGLARSMSDVPVSERLTVTGVLVGTADYLAPEQIDRAHTADARSDVYGLGGTLYFLLTGSAPFGDRATWWDKLRAHADAPVPPVRQRRPEVPAALASLLERMLAKDPADRPATPGEVADALAPLAEGADPAGLLTRLGGAAPTPRPASPSTAVTVDGRRRGLHGAAVRYTLAAGAGALAALLAAAPFLVAGRGQSPEPPGGGAPNTPPAAPNTQPAATDDVVAVEDVRLTYGPYGAPRPDHSVLPGDQIDLEFAVRGVGKNRKGEAHLTLGGEVLDPKGKRVEVIDPRDKEKRVQELTQIPVKILTDHGGSTVTGTASFLLLDKQSAGDYRVVGRLNDAVTGRAASFKQPLVVRPKEFGAAHLRLTNDRGGKWPSGYHLAVGQQVYVQMLIMNVGHDEGRTRVSVKLSASDRDGNDILSTPINPLPIDQHVGVGFTVYPYTAGPLSITQPGEVTIVAEVEDLAGNQKVRCELPVMVHLPRAAPFRPFIKE